MGGSTYDRDVYSGSSSSGWGNSSYSASRLSSSTLDSTLLPNGKIIESKTKTPIIVVLDVTGSNINFARVVYDKMPMFYGQIEQQGYLKDFDISTKLPFIFLSKIFIYCPKRNLIRINCSLGWE